MSDAALVPFPDFGLPAGANRSPLNQLSARSDGEALAAWLATFHGSPNTLRNARKEVKRLWLWAAEARGKAPSALTHEDMLAYQAFLADPQPASRWVADGHYARGHADWRPFTRRRAGQPPLSPASQRQALVILDGCFRWLVEAGYLQHNPLHLSRRSWRRSRMAAAGDNTGTLARDAAAAGRWLAPQEWRLLGEAIAALPRETDREREHYHRCRWVMALLYLAKLRISEVAQGRMGQFYALTHEGVERWWLVTHGKGGRLRKVAVVPDLLAELVTYREARGLTPLPSPAETGPLVGKLRASPGRDGISVSALHKIVKEVFRRAVTHCRDAGNPGLALRLEQASAHWLRHSGASQLLLAGADLVQVRDQLGHASVATTNTYLHSAEMARHDAIASRLRLGWSTPPATAPDETPAPPTGPAEPG